MRSPTARGVTRRTLLKASGVLGATGLLVAASPGLAISAGGTRRGDILVCVFLRGGLDGLSAVVPYGEADYYARRPNIAIPVEHVLTLDTSFGLHPALSPLATLFDRGQLAVVHAVGYPDPVRSHFRAQDLWERGLATDSTAQPGWIARHLEAVAPETAAEGPRALSLSPDLPGSLRKSVGALAVDDLASFGLGQGSRFRAGDRERFEAGLRVLHRGGSGTAALVSRAARQTLRFASRVEDVATLPFEPGAGVVYPTSQLGQRLRQAAQLIHNDAELGLEVAWIDAEGYDTHSRMGSWDGGRMHDLLADLADSLWAFHVDLEDRMHEITVVVMSEFGRQVHENSSGGCDHGEGSCMFVMGGGVRGGVYADWPGLAAEALAPGSALAWTTDFRDVLSEIVLHRLGNDQPEFVFPGHRPTPLGLVAGR